MFIIIEVGSTLRKKNVIKIFFISLVHHELNKKNVSEC